jgi:hypothetical protein
MIKTILIMLGCLLIISQQAQARNITETYPCKDGTMAATLEDCPPGQPTKECNGGEIIGIYESCSQFGPLPYCDKVDGNGLRDIYPNCFDRQDADEVTGLAPCNDGTSRASYKDCPDATGMP